MSDQAREFLEYLRDGKVPPGARLAEGAAGGYLVPEFMELTDPKGGLFWNFVATVAYLLSRVDEGRADALWRKTRCNPRMVRTMEILLAKRGQSRE